MKDYPKPFKPREQWPASLGSNPAAGHSLARGQLVGSAPRRQTAVPSTIVQGRNSALPALPEGEGSRARLSFPNSRGSQLWITQREDEKTFSWLEILQTEEASRLLLVSPTKTAPSQPAGQTDFRTTPNPGRKIIHQQGKGMQEGWGHKRTHCRCPSLLVSVVESWSQLGSSSMTEKLLKLI